MEWSCVFVSQALGVVDDRGQDVGIASQIVDDRLIDDRQIDD